MKPTEIKSVEDFFAFLQSTTETKNKDHDPNYYYRGVRNSDFKLIPSVGRIEAKKGGGLTLDEEKTLFETFKNRAYNYMKDYEQSDLELLAVAQHHELPTRLLDWTHYPLVAMYFAVREEEICTRQEQKLQEEWSCVYKYEAPKINLSDTFDPFEIGNEVKRYIPKRSDGWIIAQGVSFTVHGNPHCTWVPENLETILIHKDIRKKIKKVLNKLSINEATVFPGVDGLARHIAWLRSNRH